MDDNFLKEYLEQLSAKLDKLEVKVDDLLRYKWQIMGGTGVLSLILVFIFELAK